MKLKKQEKNVKFPQNIEIARSLERGDVKKIATKTGLSIRTIYSVFEGHRNLTDNVRVAIIELLNERKELNQNINNLTK